MKKAVAYLLAFNGALSEAIERGDLTTEKVRTILDYTQDAYIKLQNGEKVNPKGFAELGSTISISNMEKAMNQVEAQTNAAKQGYLNV